jgi:hypothetical protein
MATTRLFTGFKALLVVAALISISGCEKYVRPGKVERIITNDSWRIDYLSVSGADVSNEFIGLTLGFGEKGSVTVLGAQGVSGKWDLGINKKPTTLYLSGFIDIPYFNLNDDWVVLTASKTKLTMESDNGAHVHKLTISKVEID